MERKTLYLTCRDSNGEAEPESRVQKFVLRKDPGTQDNTLQFMDIDGTAHVYPLDVVHHIRVETEVIKV